MIPLSSASGMKVLGRHHALTRMMPARQRLEAGDLAVDMRLRLVVQREFVARDRRAQILLQRAFFAQLLVHRQFEEADRAARFRFGAEQRGLGVGDERRSVVAVLRKYAMPMVRPTAHRIAVDLDVGVEARAQIRSASASAVCGCDPVGVMTANSSPPTRARNAPSHTAPSRRATSRSRRVADRVAVHVVDGLEAVEIDAQHGEAFFRSRRQTRPWRRCTR